MRKINYMDMRQVNNGTYEIYKISTGNAYCQFQIKPGAPFQLNSDLAHSIMMAYDNYLKAIMKESDF